MKFNVGDLVCLKRNHYEAISWAFEGGRQWTPETVDNFMYGVVLEASTLGVTQPGFASLGAPVYTVQFGNECVTLPTEYFGRPTST